jgi:hypothetical protein
VLIANMADLLERVEGLSNMGYQPLPGMAASPMLVRRLCKSIASTVLSIITVTCISGDSRPPPASSCKCYCWRLRPVSDRCTSWTWQSICTNLKATLKHVQAAQPEQPGSLATVRRIAPRHADNPSLQSSHPVPPRAKQGTLPPLLGTKTPLAAGTCAPEQRAKGARKDALCAVGVEDARTLFGHVLDVQAREDEMALVRDRQRGVGVLLLETWLNDVLISRSADDPPALDLLHAQPESRKGLLAFGLEREALLGAGLTNAIVDRLYRGMYVYSVGFSDLLRVRVIAALAVHSRSV